MIRASASAPSAQDTLVLITGISGSGKSVALHALEDAGFFCVDNLPPELLRDFVRVERARHGAIQRVAIAVDVRSAASLPHLLPLIDELRGEGVAIRLSFSTPAPRRWCAGSPRRGGRIRSRPTTAARSLR